MIVWGGYRYEEGPGVSPKASYPTDGALYHPATDSWTPMAPFDARVSSAVWTGEKVIAIGELDGYSTPARSSSRARCSILPRTPGAPCVLRMRAWSRASRARTEAVLDRHGAAPVRSAHRGRKGHCGLAPLRSERGRVVEDRCARVAGLRVLGKRADRRRRGRDLRSRPELARCARRPAPVDADHDLRCRDLDLVLVAGAAEPRVADRGRRGGSDPGVGRRRHLSGSDAPPMTCGPPMGACDPITPMIVNPLGDGVRIGL